MPKIKLERPIVFIDLETTGIDKQKDRIVQICASKVSIDENGVQTKETKTMYINPEIEIPKGASDVHGITNEMVVDSPKFKSVAKGILAFIDGCDIGGFNSNRFDFPLLYAEFDRAGIQWDYRQHHFIDAYIIYAQKEKRDLAAAYKFYCDKQIENAHDAESDILATVDVFFAQLERYDDMPATISEIALMCNDGKEMLDMSGVLTYDAENEVVFNVGKNKGKKVSYVYKSDQSYFSWARANFSSDTLKIIDSIIGIKPKS